MVGLGRRHLAEAAAAGPRPAVSGTSTYDRWADSRFVRWNNALGEHFFSRQGAGQQVWLTASPALLNEVGASLSSDTEGLVAVLLAGPPWDPAPHELCRNALAAKDSWRSRRHPPPPFPLYLGYLCLFAAAGATGDGAVRVNAYYPRLRDLAHLPGKGTPRLFGRMTELWEDLERWATADQNGMLGVFRATGVGQQRHIGLPLAQNLITPTERRALPLAYEAAGLQGAAMPEAEDLADILRHSRTRGLTRLQALLAAPSPHGDRELLLGLLTDSLRLWREQTVPGDGAQRAPTPPVPRAALAPHAGLPQRGRVALAARLDRAAGRIDVFLRLHLSEFPPVPVRLQTDGGTVLSCDEQSGSWSTPLTEEAGQQCRGDAFDWRSGAALTARELGFRSALPAGSLRVLQPGLLHGLPHLLETHQLEAGDQAVLLASESGWPAVRSWGRGAAGCHELPADGLPAGWHLASVEQCPDPSPLRSLLAWLPAPAAPRLLFEGGLRSGDGARHSYLNYARPTVRLAGGTSRETLTAGAVALKAGADGRHTLPTLLGPGRHTVQAHLDGVPAAEAHIVLAVPAPAPAVPAPAGPSPASGHRWTGRRDLLLAPGLWQPHLDQDRRGREVVLLTRNGQAAGWLSTGPPPAESPVWAVPEGHNPQAVYVGCGEPASEQPLPDRPAGAWLDLLAGQDPTRGTVRPPDDELLARLWQQYVAAARARR